MCRLAICKYGKTPEAQIHSRPNGLVLCYGFPISDVSSISAVAFGSLAFTG